MPIAAVDALYVGSDRGLTAAALTAHANGSHQWSVATLLASASHGRVTDLTDVPVDTVAAQLEHLSAISAFEGLYVGALAGHATASAVFDFAARVEIPKVFNCSISGPTGETVLTARGVSTVIDNLGGASLVVLGRTDAELLSEGEIASLDDAQVAAQRLVKRGARAVLIRCGPLPARFFDIQDVERPNDVFNSDLYFDGEEFSLFEAPHLEQVTAEGASAALCVSTLLSLIQNRPMVEALSEAKRFVTEALRATQALGPGAPLQYFWERPHASPSASVS